MIRRLRDWALAEHYHGWMLKFLFAAGWTFFAYGIQDLAGVKAGQPAAYMVCGYYVFDTPKDLIFSPGDPWYDHIADTAIPCATSLGLMAVIEKRKREWTQSSQSSSLWGFLPVVSGHAPDLRTLPPGWLTYSIGNPNPNARKRTSVSLLFPKTDPMEAAQMETHRDIRW